MRKLALLPTAALGACAAASAQEVPERGASAYVCHGENLHQFVGQPATQELGAAVLRASGANRLQWVAHGMMVTMDFSPERVRVFLTADNRVERASCG